MSRQSHLAVPQVFKENQTIVAQGVSFATEVAATGWPSGERSRAAGGTSRVRLCRRGLCIAIGGFYVLSTINCILASVVYRIRFQTLLSTCCQVYSDSFFCRVGLHHAFNRRDLSRRESPR